MSKEKSKEEVQKLVEKYNQLVSSGKLKSYNEEMTKKDFILPLFRALGWKIEDGDEVTAEEKISNKRVDYGFRIEGIPKFFLEAKAMKEDLDNITFVEQAINYAWHKGCTWAVLTDFEGVKIFNAEWKSANPLQNLFFSLRCSQFIKEFDQLSLLSRESFENGIIDKEAERWGKKAKKIPVDKQLLNDLTSFREILSKNILKNNSDRNITSDDLDESVQRIIDRLIFLRTLEDKMLEPPMLQSLIREDTHKKIHKKLASLFRKIDEIYNSKLFSPHLCEELAVDDDVLEKVITGLFRTSDNTVKYDFGAIDADVLGNIYEQYLGHILKKTEKRAKLAEGKAHRKEQGIYYTPTYIVDYIVKNTVGELAKDKKFDLKNIKILDPACGSGSFLMKAFDYLVTLDKKKNGGLEQTKIDLTGNSIVYGRKVEILKNNIFGVDFDPKAVEIAQLNLLLKAAEKKHRLPMLQENIKVGNSLIDDQTIAGDKAFKWGEEFKEIIDNGGFDVVIGNPPYDVIYSNEKSKEYSFYKSEKGYISAEYNPNLFILFIDKGIDLLIEKGLLSFIIPTSFLTNKYFKNIREKILKTCQIVQIYDLKKSVFKDANIDTVILVLRKETDSKKRNANSIQIKKGLGWESEIGNFSKDTTKQESFLSNPNFVFDTNIDKYFSTIRKKVKSTELKLGDIAEVYRGMVTRKNDECIFYEKKGEKYKKLLMAREISRYNIIYENKYIFFDKSSIGGGCWDQTVYETKEKILVQLIRNLKLKQRLVAALDKEQHYTLQNLNNIIIHDKNYKSEYLLALMNSKLINYWFRNTFIDINIKRIYLKQIPIKKIDENKQKQMVALVDRVISLNKSINLLKDKQTDEKTRLEKEIQKLDDEIDQEVYRLYGLTAEEIKIVEES